MGRWRLIRLAVPAVLALLLAASPSAAGPDAADVRAALDRVFASGRIQGDLPDDRQHESGGDDPATTRGGGGAARGGGAGSAVPPAAPGAVALADGLGWVALAFGVILLVLWLLGLRGERPSSAVAAAGTKVVARPARRVALPASAGVESRAAELAAAGSIDAAVHVLLLDAAARVLARMGRAAEVALTSREIAGGAALQGDQAAGLTALVGMVERSRFGGRPLAMDDFERGRRAYRTLASTEARS